MTNDDSKASGASMPGAAGADGREGRATYFARKGSPVDVVDHSGRGRSGFDPTPIEPVTRAISSSGSAGEALPRQATY
jgi:hypothetical protein